MNRRMISCAMRILKELSLALLLLNLWIVLGTCQEDPDGSFNPKYEPYLTLIAEQKHLTTYVKNYAWSTNEQNTMPKSELIAVKMIVNNWDLSNIEDLNKNNTLKIEVESILQNELRELMEEVDFQGYHKLISMVSVNNKLLLGFCISPEKDQDMKDIYSLLVDRIEYKNLTYFRVKSGMVQQLAPVMKDTVIEIFLQLYKVQSEYGMDDPKSIKRKNMTDQMIHLIGTRFENTFGEFYYRIVIMDFIPSKNSMIVRSAVLLDPHHDNLYHASNIWQSLVGFIKLGPFPLLPENIHIMNTFMVQKEFSKYLEDRSYKRPLSEEFADNPLIIITIPSFIGNYDTLVKI
nr:uncharacterized protein LOC121122241 [Lepeophtheirus salmonis]